MCNNFKEIYSVIDSDVRARLSEFRYFHSVCVAEAASALALKYGADVEKAMLAGIGHDVFKELSAEEATAFFDSHGVLLSDIEKNSHKLWHAVSGSIYLKEQYNLDDDVISAVRYHTTGKADMTTLEKIIYVADFISADRKYDGVENMRKKAAVSLEDAMLEGLRFTVNELSEKCVPIHPDTFKAYNQICMEYNK